MYPIEMLKQEFKQPVHAQTPANVSELKQRLGHNSTTALWKTDLKDSYQKRLVEVITDKDATLVL